jgi:hypothetical protein
MEINRIDKKEEKISEWIRDAPPQTLKNWLRNASFSNFYEALWQYSISNECQIENIR